MRKERKNKYKDFDCKVRQLHAQENSSISKFTPKTRPCMQALYVFRLNISSPGVSQYLKWLCVPERIRCAPPTFYLARVRSHRVLPCSADWDFDKTTG